MLNHCENSHQLDGYIDAGVHRYTLRVQYEDTDSGGIVYHAQYLAFGERARSAWLRCLGIDLSRLLTDKSSGFVVRHIDVKFVQPASLFTILEVNSEVMEIGGASVKLRQTIRNMQSCHIVARLIVDIGFVKLEVKGAIRACRMPQYIRHKLTDKHQD